jgi:hypothetical protein
MQFQIAITYSNFFLFARNENIYRKQPRSLNYCKDQKLIEEDKFSKYSSVCEKIEKFIASIHVAV